MARGGIEGLTHTSARTARETRVSPEETYQRPVDHYETLTDIYEEPMEGGYEGPEEDHGMEETETLGWGYNGYEGLERVYETEYIMPLREEDYVADFEPQERERPKERLKSQYRTMPKFLQLTCSSSEPSPGNRL